MPVDERKLLDLYSKISHLSCRYEDMNKEQKQLYQNYIDQYGESVMYLMDEFREKAEVYLQSQGFQELDSRKQGIIYYQLGRHFMSEAWEYFQSARMLMDACTPQNRETVIFTSDRTGLNGTADRMLAGEYSLKAFKYGGLPQTIPEEEREELLERLVSPFQNFSK